MAASDGDDDDEHRQGSGGGEARPRTTLPLRCRRWRRRRRLAPWHGGRGCRSGYRRDRRRGGVDDGVPANPRAGRGGGRRCDVDEGDSDVDRRTGDEQQPAGDGAVAATPLDAGGNAPPVLPALNGGQPGEEEAAGTPRVATARPAGTRERRQRRLEVAGGTGESGGRRGEAGRGGVATGELGKGLKR
uniref:Expressed protein n=1 Tax=Oryza sativa subsp. japonica TaxID=39947 RepID=Q337X7_ORYSJ|nr:expressed protein [Oryza sativa Japonica Group]